MAGRLATHLSTMPSLTVWVFIALAVVAVLLLVWWLHGHETSDSGKAVGGTINLGEPKEKE